MNQELTYLVPGSGGKKGYCWSGVREGLWKLVAFALANEEFRKYSKDSKTSGKLTWEARYWIYLWLISGKELGRGAPLVQSLACLSANAAWCPKVYN